MLYVQIHSFQLIFNSKWLEITQVLSGILLFKMWYIHVTEYYTKKMIVLHGIRTNLKAALSKEKAVQNCVVCFIFCNSMSKKIYAFTDLKGYTWNWLHRLPSGGKIGVKTGKGGKLLFTHFEFVTCIINLKNKSNLN